LLQQGNGKEGESTAEALMRKEGELLEKRKRKWDEMVSVLLLF
jgi:hypothetical protein